MCIRDRVVSDADQLQPDGVESELAEGKLRQAGVLVVADLVLDPCPGPMATLDQRDVGPGLVGEDRLKAVAVCIGERELGAWMGTLCLLYTSDAADDLLC